MPPLPPVNVVKLEYAYSNEDASAINVMYFSWTGGTPSAAQLEGFWDGIAADLHAPYVGASVDTTHGTTQTLTDLSSDTGATYVGEDTWTGTLTGDVVSANNAVVVSHEINRRYRGGHPRSYLMVGSSSVLAGSSTKDWQATFLNNIQSGFDAFGSLFPYTEGDVTFAPCSVSYWETVAGVRTPRTDPLIDPITSYTVRARVCSQRRRLGRVGG